MKPEFKINLFFFLIITTYLLYAGFFIYKTSFVINGTRYFSLIDDAMISMRYAKNFAAGHGLGWNPGGERVEGITNPLWTLYMSFFHLFPIPAAKMSLCIQISGLIILIINLFFVRKIALSLSGGSHLVSLSAVILTAFFYPLNYHGLRGMEVCILTTIVSAAVWMALEGLRKQKFSPAIYILLAISTFIRLDMVVTYVIFWLFLVFSDKENSRRHRLYGAAILLFSLGFQTIFRLWYYGDILPNTYYLKMTGYPLIYRISRGAYVFWRYYIWERGLIFFFIPFILLLWRRDKAIRLLFLVFLGQIFYSVYVGGDVWESFFESNRFIVLAMPEYFILLAISIFIIISFLKKKILINSGYAIIMLIIILLFNTFNLDSTRHWLLVKEKAPKAPDDIFYIKRFTQLSSQLKNITTSQTKIAVTWAGAMPYFLNERIYIDILGKNDKTIARLNMHRPKNKWTGFVPGHLKWDYSFSIIKLQPDVVAALFNITDFPEDVEFYNNYFRKNYWLLVHGGSQTGAFFRKNSAQVLFGKMGKIKNIPENILKKS